MAQRPKKKDRARAPRALPRGTDEPRDADKPRGGDGRRATEDPEPARMSPATDTSVKLSASLGIVAAIVLAVVVNVLTARHYERWDWTRGGLYTLSPATIQTLRGLSEPVELYVLVSGGDPLEVSLEHLLEAYQDETTRLAIKYVDPDRNPAEFLALQQRFGLTTGRADDGRIVTDAAVVVVRNDKPYFVTPSDLVHIEDAEDLRTRPRLEEALTTAIRNVIGGDKPKVCFTIGHGEPSLDIGGAEGLAALRERLYKNNYDIAEVPPIAATPPGERPLEECRLVVVGGPSEPFTKEDVARLSAFVQDGGNALVVVGPVPNEADRDFMDLGLDPLIRLAGVKLERDFVFELRPTMRSAQGHGETFMPDLAEHDVNASHRDVAKDGVPVILTVSSSLTPLEGATLAKPLLETSEESFGMVDFFGWAQNPVAPRKREGDHAGPLMVAAAAELDNVGKAVGPDGAPRASRIIVIGSTSVLPGANWERPELRGTSLFVENSITWLVSHRVFLDIPTKEASMTGLRMTEESLNSVFRYVVVYMPGVSVLLGALIYYRRRRSKRGDSDRVAS